MCSSHAELCRLRSASLLVLPSLVLSFALLLSLSCWPSSAQPTPLLSNSSSGFYWFQPNASSLALPNSSYISPNWTDSQQLVTLYAAANSTLPLFDPVGLALVFNSSVLVAPSALGPSSPLSANVTILTTVNLAAPCTYPACVLVSTAGRNVTGSLLLSTVPVPPASGTPFQQTNQFYVQLTLITAQLNAITIQSAIPLSFSQWQYVTLIVPPFLQSNAIVVLRTVIGCEVLTFVLPADSTDTIPANLAVSSFTLGDTGGLHASFRDVAIGFQPLVSGELDSILAYFYSLYALTYPPTRMPAPAVQLINVTASQATVQLSWSPPFSPTSSIISYQLRVSSNSSTPLTAAQSFFLTFSNLTTFQYNLRRDGLSAYSFAVTACNADFPYPPIVAPLLYSTPYVAPSGNISVNSSILVLSPPPIPNSPQVYLASAPNITVQVGFPQGLNLSCALTTSPCYPSNPLTSIALFYTNDQSGSSQNFTWVTQPVWSFTASTWSWQALTTGLVGNQFYAFKVQVSNAAGGVNTSVSSGFLLPGNPSAPVSSTAAGTGNSGSGVVTNSGTASTAQSVRSSSSTTSSTAGTASAGTAVSSSVTSSTAPSSSTSPSSSAVPPGIATSDFASSSSFSSSAPAAVDDVSSTSSVFSMSSSLYSASSSAFVNATVTDSSSFGSSSNDSLIAGVIIGAFAGVVLLALLTYCCFCRKRHAAKKHTPPHSTATSTYASPRPSASLPPAVSYDKTVMSPSGGVSNRRVQANKDRAAGGRATDMNAEGDMEMAELEAEWEGDDVSHQMRPQQQPAHPQHVFRR